MADLTIVAHIRAQPEQAEHVFAALSALIEPTRQEAGCKRYDLHRDNADPAHFLFYETWESRAQWRAHMNTPHVEAYREVVGAAVASFELSELCLVEV
ncbi:MAG: putative quinol monooxygenase [Pseudomonadota bacterium]